MSTALKIVTQPRKTTAAEKTAAKGLDEKSITQRGGVRRPTRGIQIKDNTFASLRVIANNGKVTPLVDAGGKLRSSGNRQYTEVYTNFLLQGAQEARQEKSQVLETFGEPYIFLFGERARVLDFAGVLINSDDFNWEAEWWWNYENYLRGTKCVENDAQVFMSFDDTIVGGYILTASSTKQSAEPYHVTFQFQLFVTYYANISPVGNPYPKTNRKMPTTTADVAARLASGRPRLIDNLMGTRFVSSDGQVVATDLSLAEAMAQASPSSFAKSWRSMQKSVGTVLSTVSGLWSGAPVRVPSDWMGGFAYDEEDLLKEAAKSASAGNPYGVMRFSTYADNTDEYVGPGDQYASSKTTQKFLPTLGFQSIADVLAPPDSISQRAEKLLNDAGFLGKTELVDAIAGGVQKARLGLTVIVGAANVLSYKPRATVPDFTKSALFGGTQPHLDDNPYPE